MAYTLWVNNIGEKGQNGKQAGFGAHLSPLVVDVYGNFWGPEGVEERELCETALG